MARRNYTMNQLGTRDRSMILCFGSLLLFILFVAIIFLMIWGIKQKSVEVQETVHREEALVQMSTEPSTELLTDEPSKSTQSLPSTSEETTPAAATSESTTATSPKEQSSTTPGVLIIGEVEILEEKTIEDPTEHKLPCAGTGVVCETTECKQRASSMLALLDDSKQPCQDMYPYSCGRMVGNPLLSEQDPGALVRQKLLDQLRTIDTSSPRAHQIFKSFYDSCLDFPESGITERLKTIKEVLGLLGSTMDPHTDPMKLTDLVGQLLFYNVAPLFDVDLAPESFQGSSSFVFSITPPSKTSVLPGFDRRRCETPLSFPMKSFDRVVEEVSECEKKEAKNAETDIKEDEKDDFEFFKKGEKRSDEIKTMKQLKAFAVLSVDDLNHRYSGLNWTYLFCKLTAQESPTMGFARVHVYMEEHFKELTEHIENRGFRQVYMSLLSYMKIKLDQSFLHGCYDDRKDSCMTAAASLLQEPASELYLASFSSSHLTQIFSSLTRVSQKLIETFSKLLKSGAFMHLDTPSTALKKMSKLSVVTDGGIGVFQNLPWLDSRVDNTTSDNFIKQVLSLHASSRRLRYGLWLKDAKMADSIWTHFLNPMDKDIVAIPETNSVVIPYGLYALQHYLDLPDYLLFADIGWSIASAIVSLLDETGIKFDHEGQFYEAGIPELEIGASLYKQTFDILRSSYSFSRSHAVEGVFVNYTVPSQLTINDLFADCVGLYLAYTSAHEHTQQPWLPLPYLNLTAQQVFYTAAGQQLCKKSSSNEFLSFYLHNGPFPNFIRLSKLMGDQEGFSKAFDCEFDRGSSIFEFPMLKAAYNTGK